MVGEECPIEVEENSQICFSASLQNNFINIQEHCVVTVDQHSENALNSSFACSASIVSISLAGITHVPGFLFLVFILSPVDKWTIRYERWGHAILLSAKNKQRYLFSDRR